MTAFSAKPRRNFFSFLALLVVLACPAAIHQAAAQPAGQASENVPDPDDAPGTIRQDFKKLEPIGVLSGEGDGGLGIDVWYGSDRSDVTEALARAPRITYFRTMQDLVRRLMLTPANPEFLESGGRPKPGNDLLTLRIEKLEQMGLYDEAVKLYSQILGEPYHERLARAGVLSMLQSGKGSLGCLETRTVIERFGSLDFWRNLDAVCDLVFARLMANSGKTDMDAAYSPGDAGIARGDFDLADSGSAVLAGLASKSGYAFHATGPDDIERLKPLERAALQANGALLFDRFTYEADAAVSPPAFGLMRDNRKISEDGRFSALVRSVAFGLKPVGDVKREYNQIKNVAKSFEGWRRLVAAYKQVEQSETGQGKVAPIVLALSLQRGYGGIFAAAPFADALSKLDPSLFPNESVSEAVRLLVVTGRPVSQKWFRRLGESTGNGRNAMLLVMAAELSTDLSTESNLNSSSLKSAFDSLSDHDKTLLAVIYEKLDNGNKLHNYFAAGTYEKLVNLTGDNDYVMPVNDITTALSKAYDGKNLGEAVLLSAIALKGAEPGSLNPGLLQDVLGGLRTVGLTSEARYLAIEIILGLSK